MAFRKEVIGDCELYLGDCREVLPRLRKVDAVVTDPPYGLGDKLRIGGNKKWPLVRKDGTAWDEVIVDFLPDVLALASISIVWGGHLYSLPPSRAWLIWDKKQTDKFSSGSAEMAWTNLDQPIRQFRLSQVEAYCEPHQETKVHPTQKPLPLMQWCLGFIHPDKVILDPFMGSGTTGVACMKLGRKFFGVEIEPRYFDMACKRIDNAAKQPDMFVEPQPRAEQMDLLRGQPE